MANICFMSICYFKDQKIIFKVNPQSSLLELQYFGLWADFTLNVCFQFLIFLFTIPNQKFFNLNDYFEVSAFIFQLALHVMLLQYKIKIQANLTIKLESQLVL